MSEDSATVRATKNATGPAAGDGVAPHSSTTLSATTQHSMTTASSANTSATNSPKVSREPSPSRPPLKPGASSSTKGLRSRNNSQDVGSPSRRPSVSSIGGSTVPSAAAVQRALSIANTPHLQPTVVSEPSARAPRSQHSAGGTPGDNTPHWPASPRLKSPPNASSTRQSFPTPRGQETVAQPPSIHIQRPIAVNSTRQVETRASATGGMPEDQVAATNIQKPSRGASAAGPTLETVQESSLPATPAITSAPLSQAIRPSVGEPSASKAIDKSGEDQARKTARIVAGSGSESGGNKSDSKSSPKRTTSKNAPKTNSMPPLKSFTSTLSRTRGKPAKEGSTQNMTVETETVSSIPQVAVGGGAGERGLTGRTDTGGSLRLKLSTETIRPKKDKKKTVRKAPSINSGTGGFLSRFPKSHHHHTFSRRPSEDNSSSGALISPFHNHFAPHDYASASSNSSSTCWDGQNSAKSSVPSLYPSTSSTKDSKKSHSLRVSLTKHVAQPASSKADIFEAKVASAVDEANSSDSEETFVYESNPPDPYPSRSDRFHSRTPSATSMKSQIGQRGAIRSAQNLHDGTHTIAGKRSMKFTNNFNNPSNVPEGDTNLRGDGTVRKGYLSNIRSATGNGFHHPTGHNGRGSGGHASLFDNSSIYPHTSRPIRSSAGNTPRLPSAPSSPRSPHYMRLPGVSGKKLDEVSPYDIEADDERTPLVGSVRSNRSRQSRRPNSGTFRQLKLNQQRQQGWFARFACCLALTVLIVLALLAAVAFLFATTKPLLNVEVREIQNVLASEQAIMLDLLVEAVNPNVIAVTVTDMDVNIFAKSKHVGSDRLWRDRPLSINESFGRRVKSRYTSLSSSPISSATRVEDVARVENGYPASRGVDEGNDPMPDPEGDSQTMLLGRIFEFDSALSFDGSPFKRHPSTSVGELRLAKPGNKTEQGGTQRWERVIQHRFELIVRGVLKYQLPLNSRLRTAPIGASILVHAEEGVDASGLMRLESMEHDYQPGSNVLIGEPSSTGNQKL